MEQWRDDGKNIGGKIDYMVLNENNVVIEIADTKTGKIFEYINKKLIFNRLKTNGLCLLEKALFINNIVN